ncbi:MAG: PilN domain-containing protein [Acidobacteria bacterium]|nr:PilN domain-containing protein [Acidobacteriota bacterium]MCB9396923.1 PilN domain-containing protein [Acidobacteriota bacterium]
MIKINLIRERKAAAVKSQKKKSQASSGVQENLILIIFVALAAGALIVRNMMLSSTLDEKLRIASQKEAEYKKLEPYKEKQLDYEIRKELLNEKIKKIGELKDRREGPVKLLEDIYNNLPSSVYLLTIEQGVDSKLLDKTDKNAKTFTVKGKQLGAPNIIRITGISKTIDGASTLANRLQAISQRYSKVDLNTIETVKSSQDDYKFTILFVTKLEDGDTDGAADNRKSK